MVLYIDSSQVKDKENISNEVFKYLIEKAKPEIARLNKLYKAYLGGEKEMPEEKDDNEVKVKVNYNKYVVNNVRNFYLGEPIKYDNNEKSEKKKKQKKAFNSLSIPVSVQDGSIVVHEWDKLGEKKIDISAVVDAYDNQGISKVDSKIGKYMAIFGSAQELIYASDEENPQPKSAAILPQNCIFVCDDTIEHRELFFMTFEEVEKINKQKYYRINVYTDQTSRQYKSADLENFMFTAAEAKEHHFGFVPCINYDNDDERQGDVEDIVSLSNAYSDLMSNRLTDKKKFINAVLAVFGFELPEDQIKIKDNQILLDGVPNDGRIEYIQKVFDEASVKILADDLVRDIHKMSSTVDMSDESFSGNITGVALEMKFLPMASLAKTKIRNMDEGLKRRFEIYNAYLTKLGAMSFVSKNDIDVVFTIDMPSNLKEIVEIVVALEGRVDEQTLLALLPFVKDPAEMVEIMKKQKEENQKKFLDSFGNGDTEEEPKDGQDGKDKEKLTDDE